MASQDTVPQVALIVLVFVFLLLRFCFPLHVSVPQIWICDNGKLSRSAVIGKAFQCNAKIAVRAFWERENYSTRHGGLLRLAP